MRQWTEEDAREGFRTPPDVRDLASELGASFRQFGAGGFPHAFSIGKNDGHDGEVYVVLVELTHGLKLTMEIQRFFDDLDGKLMEVDVVAAVLERVLPCLPMLDRLSDAVHDMRLVTRRALAEWASEGVHARLLDVRIVPMDQWHHPDEVGFEVVVEGLNDQLLPEPIELMVASPTALAGELLWVRPMLEIAAAKRREFDRLGASGRIDRLALNAIAAFGDIAEHLRRFSDERIFWLPDLTAIAISNGEVSAGNGTSDAKVRWSRDGIAVDGLVLPPTSLIEAVGRPVTDLIDHRFLSADMYILEASSETEDDSSSVVLTLEMPRLLFCSLSGRTWEEAVQSAP